MLAELQVSYTLLPARTALKIRYITYTILISSVTSNEGQYNNAGKSFSMCQLSGVFRITEVKLSLSVSFP